MSDYVLHLGEHPTRIDLSVHGGEPVDMLIEVLDALGVATSTVGWTASVEIISMEGNPVATLSPSLEVGGLGITATAADTTAWLAAWPRECRWKIRGQHPDGEPIFRGAGWVLLYP